MYTWQAAASKLVAFKKTLTLWSDEVPLGELAISMECVNCIKNHSLISIIIVIPLVFLHSIEKTSQQIQGFVVRIVLYLEQNTITSLRITIFMRISGILKVKQGCILFPTPH